MLAMQYRIRLPSDYDMSIIYRRVADRGAAFNGLPGLLCKFFLVRENAAGGDNEPGVNEYAPFYLWNNTEGLRDFLLSGKFEGVSRSFGRPGIETWQVLEFYAAGEQTYPGYANFETALIPDSADLSVLANSEKEAHTLAVTASKALLFRLVALDLQNWEVLRVTVSKEQFTTVATTSRTYQLLYTAQGQ
jgi:hypothetical protein